MILIDLIGKIILALIFTLIIEITIAYLLKFRKKEEIQAIIAVNLITNPALNYFIQLNSQYNIISTAFTTIILLEALIVIIEFILLSLMLKQDKKRLFILSLLINIISFLFGLLIINF